MKIIYKEKGGGIPKAPELSEEEEAYENAVKVCEEVNNKEFIDFLKKYVNNGERGIKPSNFVKKALLGEKTFRNVIIHENKPLKDAFKLRICIGIGLEWTNIVRLNIDNSNDPPQTEMERENRVNELKEMFIRHMGDHMKNIFILMKKGIDLNDIARHEHNIVDKSKNLKKKK